MNKTNNVDLTGAEVLKIANRVNKEVAKRQIYEKQVKNSPSFWQMFPAYMFALAVILAVCVLVFQALKVPTCC